MIPINPLAMMIGFLIFIFSQVLLGLLIACLLAFFIPRCRRYMLARRWRFGLMILFLTLASVPYVWSEVTEWRDCVHIIRGLNMRRCWATSCCQRVRRSGWSIWSRSTT